MRIEVLAPGRAWAEAVSDELVAAVEASPELLLCLPTGATPRALYHHVAPRLDLSRATVVQLDEFGGLPVGDPARCDTMLAVDLLDRLAAPPARVLRLDPDDADHAGQCRAMEEAIAPGIDLTLLGLGANGHVALNEPGDTERGVRRVPLSASTADGALGYGASRRPEWGLTLGLDAIMASREVWLLVTGTHKAAILARALEGPVGIEVPASLLREHPGLVVLADADAAAQLS